MNPMVRWGVENKLKRAHLTNSPGVNEELVEGIKLLVGVEQLRWNYQCQWQIESPAQVDLNYTLSHRC